MTQGSIIFERLNKAILSSVSKELFVSEKFAPSLVRAKVSSMPSGRNVFLVESQRL